MLVSGMVYIYMYSRSKKIGSNRSYISKYWWKLANHELRSDIQVFSDIGGVQKRPETAGLGELILL